MFNLKQGIVCAAFALVHSFEVRALAQSVNTPIAIQVTGKRESDRRNERAFATSEAATVTDAEAIKEQNPGSLADAVRKAPSVSVQQTTPGQGTVYVRGFSGRAVMYAIDGVQLNMAFFRAGNNDYLGLVDPYALDNVTVVPGATSAEYGSDALGGAVLMSTGLPGYRLGSGVARVYTLQTVTSNPVGTASRVQVVREARNWAGQAGFTHYQAGPVRPGEGVLTPDPYTYAGLTRSPDEPYRPRQRRSQLGTEFETYASDVAARIRLGSGLHFVARGQLVVRPELVRYDRITPRFKREFPSRAEAGLRPMWRGMVSGLLSHRQLDGFYDRAEVLLAWQRIFERRFDRHLDEICVPDPSLVTDACPGLLRLTPARSQSSEENSSDALSLRADVYKASPDKMVTFKGGLDGRFDLVRSSAESIDLDTTEKSPESPRYPDGSSMTELGIYGLLRFEALPRFHISAGARGSVFQLDVRPRTGDVSAPAVQDTLMDATGSLGTHWEFVDGLVWAVNGARGVRSPNIEDYAGLGERAGGRFQVPNPELGPEHSYTADTGIKVSRGRQRAQSFVFYSRYQDAVTLAPTTVNGAAVSPQGDRFYHSMNASSVALYGAEAFVDLGLTRRLSTSARVLIMRGVQRNPPETDLPAVTPADRVPPPQAELTFGYAATPSLEFELSAVGRAPQRRLNDPVNLDDNRIPKGGTPGYMTYHARAKYALNEPLMLRVSLDNFTDELVLDHGSGFYRAGFSAMLGLEGRLQIEDAEPAPRQR